MIAKAKPKRKRKPSWCWTVADWLKYRPGQPWGRLLSFPEKGPWYYRTTRQDGKRSFCDHTFRESQVTGDHVATENGTAVFYRREPITRKEYVNWLEAECGYRRGPFQHPEPQDDTPRSAKRKANPLPFQRAWARWRQKYKTLADWFVAHPGEPVGWFVGIEPGMRGLGPMTRGEHLNGNAAYLARYQTTCCMLRDAGLTPKPFDEWVAQVKAQETRQAG